MTPGLYLVIVSAIYLIVGIIDLFVYRFAPIDVFPIVYALVVGAPLLFKPLGRAIGFKRV